VQVDVVEPWLEEIKWENYYPSLSMIIHYYPLSRDIWDIGTNQWVILKLGQDILEMKR